MENTLVLDTIRPESVIDQVTHRLAILVALYVEIKVVVPNLGYLEPTMMHQLLVSFVQRAFKTLCWLH